MFAGTLRELIFHCREMGLFANREGINRGQFRRELAELGLLGWSFDVEECRCAVERLLDVAVAVEMMPDSGLEEWSEDLSSNGNLAEVAYDPVERRALIVFRETLLEAPWPAYELALYHELGHLIGRHQETTIDLSLFVPEKLRLEADAQRRAKWLLLASHYPDSFAEATEDRVA